MSSLFFLLFLSPIGFSQKTPLIVPVLSVQLEQKVTQHLLAHDRKEDWIEEKLSDEGIMEMSFVFDDRLYTIITQVNKGSPIYPAFLNIEIQPLPLGECSLRHWHCSFYTQSTTCEKFAFVDRFDISGQGTVDIASSLNLCHSQTFHYYRSFSVEDYDPVGLEQQSAWQEHFELSLLDILAFFQGETYCVSEDTLLLERTPKCREERVQNVLAKLI